MVPLGKWVNTMSPKGPFILVTLIMAMTVAAAAILIAEVLPQPQHQERSEEFQRLVGGLGFGPAVDLSGCVYTFDPRLGDGCSYDLGPIPGGADFCPHHSCSVLYYPPLNETSEIFKTSEVWKSSAKHGEVP
jgi:hypothetical protein